MNHLIQPEDGLEAAALILAGCALAFGLGELRRFLRHLGMKRLRYINTVAAPTVPDGPDDPPFDGIEALVAAHQPQPVGELEQWSIANWKRIPYLVRVDCVHHLHGVLIKAVDWPQISAKWKQQKADGIRIGSDAFGFHFGTGIFVRNVLREIVSDDLLPAVEYPDGQMMRNWDDYYYGALDELAGRL